jgi:hypothetical protein
MMTHQVRVVHDLTRESKNSPLGTVRPLYRTGVLLLQTERFSYI